MTNTGKLFFWKKSKKFFYFFIIISMFLSGHLLSIFLHANFYNNLFTPFFFQKNEKYGVKIIVEKNVMISFL